MNKRAVIHMVKTLIFCNGIASAICSVLVIMFMMLSGKIEYIVITAVAYTVMAIYSGRLAAKGLPSTLFWRYLPAVIPPAVTIIAWTVCYAVSGGSYDTMISGGAFTVYAVTQATHFAVITICKQTGAYIQAFLMPLSFNLMFLFSFTAFERISKERVKTDDPDKRQQSEI